MKLRGGTMKWGRHEIELLEDGEVFVVEHYVVCGVFCDGFGEVGEGV